MAKKDKKIVEDESTTDTKQTKNLFTYVGGGDSSPPVINFMGRQKFVRGQVTEVTDDVVLEKIKNNPSFVEGEADLEDIHKMDAEEATRVQSQQKADQRINAAFMRKHSGSNGEE